MISFTKSKKKIASSYLFSINSRKMEFGQIISPAALNREMAKTMLDDANAQDPTDITTHKVGASKIDAYINSTDMTELLHLLTLGDIYQNARGKKEVALRIRRGRKGKPEKSDMTYTRPSGRPSVYGITQKIEKLKALVSKPEACDRIRKALVDSGLVCKYEKFMIQALYYALRKDKSVADKLFRLFVSPVFVKNPQFKTFQEKLLSLDEKELDQVSNETARISIENHGYDGFLFSGGLLHLVSKVSYPLMLESILY
jgi:hypothetical protein